MYQDNGDNTTGPTVLGGGNTGIFNGNPGMGAWQQGNERPPYYSNAGNQNGGFGGGGGGGVHTQAAAAPATGAPGTFGPDVVLGPDGNVYGTSFQYDPVTNARTYTYKLFGPATDLNAVSTASGIPIGMLQQAVQQQQVTLNTLAAQGAINPYSGGAMTQQQLQQSLDAVRSFQQYQSAQYMQGVDPQTGLNYAQEQGMYDAGQAGFQYRNQAGQQQATLYGQQQQNAYGQNYNTQSGINGQTYGQLGLQNNNSQAAQQYASSQNYNTQSGVNGMTYGQLGLQNDNGQAIQQYNYNQNYMAANPYTGMSNAQTGLEATNASNAYGLAQNQYNLGSADYTGGQTRQQYSQGTQDLQNQYDRSNSTYQLGHQANQQALSTYNEATKGMQDAKNVSRSLTGTGWAGIARPSVAGWQ
jgi:hypothetical protein